MLVELLSSIVIDSSNQTATIILEGQNVIKLSYDHWYVCLLLEIKTQWHKKGFAEFITIFIFAILQILTHEVY